MAEPGLQVLVRFPEGVPADVQGPVLLCMEMMLRTLTKQDVRCVKDLQGDDSKLRVKMTPIQRMKL